MSGSIADSLPHYETLALNSANPQDSMIARYNMIVMSNPVDGHEAEYNHWYQNIHLGEMVALPGIRSARRFRRVRNLKETDSYANVAVYDIETDDVDGVLQGVAEAAGKGQLNMSVSIDTGNAYAVIYEECGPVVSEP